MRTLTSTILVGVLAATLGGCGGRTDQSPNATPGVAGAATANAADTYRGVSASLGDPLLDAIKNERADNAALAKHAADFDRLVVASQSPDCDFGVDTSAGFGADLPHLAMLKGLARALKADAARLLAAGDTDGAARRTAAILRMSVQLSRQGRFMIELLTASAIARLGADFIVSNPPLARAAWKTDIQNALVEVERGGTLDSWAVLQREADLSARWMREGSLPDMRAQGGHNWPALTEAERAAAAEMLEGLMSASGAAWRAPDAGAELGRIAARAAGQPADDLFPKVVKVRATIDDLNVSIVGARAALDQ